MSATLTDSRSARRAARQGALEADGRAVGVALSAEFEDHEAWAALEQSGQLTPFQTRAWLRHWYRIVAPALRAEPVIATIFECGTGQPLMVLPLCCRRERGLRILEFAGIEVSDYNAPLVAEGFAPSPAEMERLLRQVQRMHGAADLFRLERLPHRIGTSANPLARISAARPMGFGAWAMPLADSRETFDAGLDPSFRKELRRKGRRLAGRGAVDFCHSPSQAEGRAFFGALRRERAARFAELGRNDILGDPVFCRFYEAVLFDEPEPIAVITALRVDGEIAATMLGLHHRKAYYLVMSAFDATRWKSASPGAVGIDQLASRLIAQGFDTFDLTIGDEAYKQNFGAVAQALCVAELAASWRGAPTILRGQVKAVLKRTLPQPVLARLRRL